MTSKHVKVLRDRRADKPEAANNRLKALRAAFKWGAASDCLRENPARDVAPLKNPSEGFHTWTLEDVRAFERCHPIGSKARLALGILLYLGVRRSDAVRLGPQHVRDGFVCFVQYKLRRQRMTTLELPILPPLLKILNASQVGKTTFLETEYGKPFTAAGFGGWFRDRCDEAGLPHCSAHGLRKAGATTAAENGATTHQLMAMFGWSTMKEPERYTRKARQKLIADGAMALLVPRASAGSLAQTREHEYL
jgi:integrase